MELIYGLVGAFFISIIIIFKVIHGHFLASISLQDYSLQGYTNSKLNILFLFIFKFNLKFLYHNELCIVYCSWYGIEKYIVFSCCFVMYA